MIAISKVPALTAREPRVVITTSGCISHTWPSHGRKLNPQSSVPSYILLHILPTPDGWKPELSLSALGIEPRPSAHMSEHVSEQLTPLTNWARQTLNLWISYRQGKWNNKLVTFNVGSITHSLFWVSEYQLCFTVFVLEVHVWVSCDLEQSSSW